jgi:xylulokinase
LTASTGPQYALGLDSSTQSMTAVVLDIDGGCVVFEDSVVFDRDLPRYLTRNGVLTAEEPTRVHAPPGMWVDALEAILEKVCRAVDPGRIAAISGAGQQHGSVYWNAKGQELLATMPDRQRSSWLQAGWSRETAPVWMDSSTSRECNEIRDALGGIAAACRATGSDIFERFTGPQIRRFAASEPEAWQGTTHVSLVSSFLASVLVGRLAPLEPGDAAGMNLMDIETRQWHSGAVAATEGDLLERLPVLVDSSEVIGGLHVSWRRLGLRPETPVVVWTGDNPSSVAGVGLTRPGMVAISLGTSDTLFATMDECRVDESGAGHVFGAPTTAYMSLLCFRNGSLARERLRDSYKLDWEGFTAALEQSEPGCQGGVMVPWYEAEIVPRVSNPGPHRQGLREASPALQCRALVEGQMTAMRLHSEWTGQRPHQIVATGGAAGNRAILQVMADVFECEVRRLRITSSAAMGAALRAAHAVFGCPWDELSRQFVADQGRPVQPHASAAPAYAELRERYRALESTLRAAAEHA